MRRRDFGKHKPWVKPTEENTSDARGVDAIKDTMLMYGVDEYEAEEIARENGWIDD